MTIHCSLGHENPDGSAFCDECGERLGAGAEPEVPGVAPPTEENEQPGEEKNARLVVQSDNTEFDLSGKSEVVIGREDPISNIFPDIDLTAHGGEEGGVSRLHAKLYIADGQYMIEDQNSTNSTFVNRQKLTPKTPAAIRSGDEIRLGKVVLVFEAQ